MRRFLTGSWALLKGLPLAILGPIFLAIAAIVLLLADLVAWVIKLTSEAPAAETSPATKTASVVIPNWNGRDLLAKYIPSIIEALRPFPGSEIIVVDNGSADGSVELLRSQFPEVRVLALPTNLGFGGGTNAGFAAARNDIVVLMNSDMRVDPEFLQPLLDGFTDAKVFAVSCQIFIADPSKPRQETGLTEGWWLQGGLRVTHRVEPDIDDLYPCFYGGGGSCAYDRRKFLELGSMDELLKPFYLEDTDISYMAWKRGWKVLYQPRSIVYHEHRSTIGKRFSEAYIQSVLKKNFILFVWKNIHDWRWMASHFFFAWSSSMLSWLAVDSPERSNFTGIARAFLSLPRAVRSRIRARHFSTISDREAFRRPLGGHFRDTFLPLTRASRPSVLFVSPYPICPPVHGGGVFMYQTIRELVRLCDVHLITLLDFEKERKAHEELDRICASTKYIVRMEGRQKAIGSPEPHAVREFRNRDLAWLIHRQIYTKGVDVLQLEYTVLGQYAGGFRRIPSILFEHDVYFQSIARRIPFMNSVGEKINARWEYLRSLRYELRMLEKPDRIQVCTRENADYLRSFLPALNGKVDDGYRAGIDTSLYRFQPGSREPYTLLFLGSFRHLPNVEALNWFVDQVFPLIRRSEPKARLVVIGSDPPPRHSFKNSEAIELIGFVEDVREPLAKYGIFVCPILSGSGIRVKLLEAFAAGIPVVSTRLGAEGLAATDGEVCALADEPAEFAQRVLELLGNPSAAKEMAERARNEVASKRDMRVITERLVESYKAEIARMRGVS